MQNYVKDILEKGICQLTILQQGPYAQMTITILVVEKASMCLENWRNIKPVHGVVAGVWLGESQELY